MNRIGFTGAGIDRADNLRLDEDKLAGLATNLGARLMRLNGLDPVLDREGRIEWGSLAEWEGDRIFLGIRGETPLFAPLVRAVPGQRAWSVFGLLAGMDPADAALWGGARSLNEWHGKHGFCGICGSATLPFRAGWGRRCGNGHDHFPRVDPVAIMTAEFEGRILLARQPQYPAGRYSALAGFIEPGESVEEAVARELFEEAALQVRDVRYVASQPWPFPGQLMIACTATALSDSVTLDRTELEDSMWVDRAGVRSALAGEAGAPFLAPPPFAIAHTLLRHWADG
ncbi:MAG TPA: NAD(+) diphosphatase [Allosphingosinicella sp.]|jgi:NAD+ diphosphatase